MTQKNEYLEYLVLNLKYHDRGYDLIDHAIAQGEDVPVKNMCAKVHPIMIEKVQECCKTLGISQRRFIESAVAEALRQTMELIEEHFAEDLEQ